MGLLQHHVRLISLCIGGMQCKTSNAVWQPCSRSGQCITHPDCCDHQHVLEKLQSPRYGLLRLVSKVHHSAKQHVRLSNKEMRLPANICTGPADVACKTSSTLGIKDSLHQRLAQLLKLHLAMPPPTSHVTISTMYKIMRKDDT